MRVLKVLALFGLLLTSTSSAQARHRWFFSSPARHVVLLTHGLNMKPAAMDALAVALQNQNMDVLRVALSGHNNDLDVFKAATRLQWIREIDDARQEAQEHARGKNLPLSLVGYSIGALLSLDLMETSEHPRPPFHRMVLLAPALELRDRSKWIKLLGWLGDETTLPSKSPPAYRAHPATPLAGYKALLKSYEILKENGIHRLSKVPTLILVDPKDELVSPKGLQEGISHLPYWSLETIEKTQAPLKPNFHHLMVDEASLGSAAWTQLRQRINQHLTD